jgi:hypothetical protein
MRVLRRLGLPALVVVGLAFFVGAGLLARSSSQPIQGQPALVAIIPLDGAQILRQDVVGVNLQVGWTGILTVNGKTIPHEQLEPDNGLNQMIFKPGPGKVITELQASRNCAEIVFWRLPNGRDTAGPPRRWCFDAL